MIGYFNGKYAVQFKLDDFLQQYPFDKVHVVLGCGFETRSPVIFDQLAKRLPKHTQLECTVVDILNRVDPAFSEARELHRKNMSKLKMAASSRTWKMKMTLANLDAKKMIAHRPLLSALRSTLRRFSGDFLVDISSLPRSIMFPALKLLWHSNRARNLFVAYTEDKAVGNLEKQAVRFRGARFIPLFPLRKSSRLRVWLPILGGDSRPVTMIRRCIHFDDIHPVVGFPSSRPIETDEIVRRNKDIVSKHRDNLIFASMNDPFQLSMKLNSTIDEVRSCLGDDTTLVLSPHGSKPQSVGALMTAVAKNTAILYCQPYSYRSRPGEIGDSRIYWLKGDAYG